MSNYKEQLQQNNNELSAILETVNSLPEASTGGGSSSNPEYVTVSFFCSTNGGALEIINDGITTMQVFYHSANSIGSRYRVMISEAQVGAAIVVFEAITTAPTGCNIIKTGSNYTVMEVLSTNSGGGDSSDPDSPSPM